MTNTKYVKSQTTKDLEKELAGLNSAIDDVECFSTRDLALRECIDAELYRRSTEQEYKKYVQNCLDDPNFEITHLEDFDSWVESEEQDT